MLIKNGVELNQLNCVKQTPFNVNKEIKYKNPNFCIVALFRSKGKKAKNVNLTSIT